jgi:hypothetical protein
VRLLPPNPAGLQVMESQAYAAELQRLGELDHVGAIGKIARHLFQPSARVRAQLEPYLARFRSAGHVLGLQVPS